MGYPQFKLLIVSDGRLYKTIEKEQQFKLSTSTDSFLADYCTIVLPFIVRDSSVWVAIPCDRTVNAAYVCQKYRIKSEIYNPTPITEACEQG